tara:strand:- start:432 stop:626 length:195 start_codon:yes stop_codon:yes gene_type:complete
MDFGIELKKAMLDNGIDGAKQLSEEADMSYNKVIRALNSDSSSRLVDVVKLATILKLKLVFIPE